MSRAAPPRPQALTVAGPAGPIEALLENPLSETAAASRFAVVCHPHPLHGGTMTNKVAHMLARALNDAGIPVLRFNFRGVGASAGVFDEGRGETQDALAVIRHGRERFAGAALVLAGFSFGGYVALAAAAEADAQVLITVAPAVSRFGAETFAAPAIPWLLLMGTADELIDWQEMRSWAQAQAHPPECRWLEGASHFFHGRLTELRQAVVDFVQKN
ncbi:MAG: alpha/beta fold hydrolase [Steroidobacteraceae bacterium]